MRSIVVVLAVIVAAVAQEDCTSNSGDACTNVALGDSMMQHGVMAVTGQHGALPAKGPSADAEGGDGGEEDRDGALSAIQGAIVENEDEEEEEEDTGRSSRRRGCELNNLLQGDIEENEDEEEEEEEEEEDGEFEEDDEGNETSMRFAPGEERSLLSARSDMGWTSGWKTFWIGKNWKKKMAKWSLKAMIKADLEATSSTQQAGLHYKLKIGSNTVLDDCVGCSIKRGEKKAQCANIPFGIEFGNNGGASVEGKATFGLWYKDNKKVMMKGCVSFTDPQWMSALPCLGTVGWLKIGKTNR